MIQDQEKKFPISLNKFSAINVSFLLLYMQKSGRFTSLNNYPKLKKCNQHNINSVLSAYRDKENRVQL
jgi:hypothetical protein